MREGNGAAQEAPLHATVYHSSVIYFQEEGSILGPCRTCRILLRK